MWDQVSAIVTQPPAEKGRGKKLSPSPVAELAMEHNFPTNKIFWPEKAGEVCNYILHVNPLFFQLVSSKCDDV
jgi:methionyl-tRNA formyltransferase